MGVDARGGCAQDRAVDNERTPPTSTAAATAVRNAQGGAAVGKHDRRVRERLDPCVSALRATCARARAPRGFVRGAFNRHDAVHRRGSLGRAAPQAQQQQQQEEHEGGPVRARPRSHDEPLARRGVGGLRAMWARRVGGGAGTEPERRGPAPREAVVEAAAAACSCSLQHTGTDAQTDTDA